MIKGLDKILHNGSVYYRKNDILKEYKDSGIKVGVKKFNDILENAGIKCKTIEGFGRTLWIVETDVNRIFVEGTNISHNTKVIEKEETIKSNLSMNEFCSFLMQSSLKLLPPEQRETFLEESRTKSITDAITKYDNFEKNNKDKDESKKMREEVKKYNDYWREEGLSYRMLAIKFVNPNVKYENDSSGKNTFIMSIGIDSNGTILESDIYDGDSGYYLNEDDKKLHDIYEERDIRIVPDENKRPFKITDEYIKELLNSCTLDGTRVSDSWVYIQSKFGEIQMDEKALLGGMIIDIYYEEDEYASEHNDVVDVTYTAV